MSIKGQVAVITGGGKGTGLGIARALVKEGVDIVITGRHSDALEDARAELEALREGGFGGYDSVQILPHVALDPIPPQT